MIIILSSTEFRTTNIQEISAKLSQNGEELVYESNQNSNTSVCKFTTAKNEHIWVKVPYGNVDIVFPLFDQNQVLIGGAARQFNNLNILAEWNETNPIWTLQNNWEGEDCFVKASEVALIGSTIYFAWAFTSEDHFVFSGHSLSDASSLTQR